jgi:hypothetical protein
VLTNGNDGTDTLTNMERLVFADGNIAFDTGVNEIAGAVFRLYQAALDRTPDTAGLWNWINYADAGHSFDELAAAFLSSAEFAAKYGVNVSNEVYITKLYENSLGRTPDAGGLTTWVNALNVLTRTQVMNAFSECDENRVNTAWQTDYGIGNGVLGTKGVDRFTSQAGSELFLGGPGTDTLVLHGNRANYTVVQTAKGYTVTDTVGTDGVDTLVGVERLQFADGRLAIDWDSGQVSGEVYRIYQAAFNRTPDLGGVANWVNAMDGGYSLVQTANAFIDSAEFHALYGASPTNAELVTLLYANVLHRAPDQGGYDYWLNKLDSHIQTPAEVLIGFSESVENQAALIGVIQYGIWLGNGP